jgi:hypothetical protein
MGQIKINVQNAKSVTIDLGMGIYAIVIKDITKLPLLILIAKVKKNQ